MTQERAKYILRTRDAFGGIRYGFHQRNSDTHAIHADGMTRDEWHLVVNVWRGMPGYTCFMDALLRVSRGEVPPAT